MKEWDGKTERRKVSDESRDLLVLVTRIDANLSNHIETVAKHVVDDETRFSKLDKDSDFQKKILYGGLGIILFVEFVLKLIK